MEGIHFLSGEIPDNSKNNNNSDDYIVFSSNLINNNSSIPLDHLKNQVIEPVQDFEQITDTLCWADGVGIYFNETPVGPTGKIKVRQSEAFAWSHAETGFAFQIKYKNLNSHAVTKGSSGLPFRHIVLYVNAEQEDEHSDFVITEIHIVMEDQTLLNNLYTNFSTILENLSEDEEDQNETIEDRFIFSENDPLLQPLASPLTVMAKDWDSKFVLPDENQLKQWEVSFPTEGDQQMSDDDMQD